MAFGALNNTNFNLSGAVANANANAMGPLSTTPAPTTPPPPVAAGGLDSFDASSYGLNANRTAKLDKYADIISSGGTLTPQQEKRLSNISERAGLDFASTLNYNPTSGRYTYTPEADPAGVRAQNYTGDDIRIANSGGSGDVTAVSAYGDQPPGGMVDNPWTASAGDLYQNLNPNQEKKFDRLSDLYAESLTGGEALRPGQLSKLDKLLGKADLGTREEYFAPVTYTGITPEDFTARAGGMTYEDLANLYTSGDPILLYATAQKYGLTPEDIQASLGGYSKSYYAPTAFEQDINRRLSAGEADYQNFSLAALYYRDPNNEIFNDPAVKSRAETALYTYQNPVTGPTTATTTNKRGEEIAGSGQYGYMNNAPILNADVLDSLLDERGRLGSKAFNSDLIDELGWNFKSGEGLNFVQKGVRVLGLNEKQFSPSVLSAMDSNTMTVDPETGQEYDQYASQRQSLNTAAERIGIDPSQYESASDLYYAVENASQDLYQVVGGYKNQWGEEASNIDDKGNHANVIYRNVNGQLMPIAVDLFKYTRPKDSIIGGTVGEILGSVPFLPEIVGFATGNPAIYAGLKGAQTASRPGADFGDVVVSTALAYYTPTVAKEISNTIGGFISPEFAQANPFLTDYITKVGTNLSMNIATSALRGQDIDLGDMITTALMTTGIQMGSGELLKLTDFPPEMQNVLAGIISRVATGGDIQSAVTNAITRVGINAMRNSGKQQTTTEQTAG